MKQSYTLPRPKMWLMILILIITCFGTPFVVVMLQHRLLGLDGMTEFNSRYGGPFIIFIVFPALVAIIALILTRPLYYKKLNATIENQRLIIKKRNGDLLFDIPICNIHTFFFMNEDNGSNLKLWNTQGQLIAEFTSSTIIGRKYARDMQGLFNDLRELTQATEGKTIPQGSKWSRPGTYYHSTNSRQTEILPTEQFQQKVKKKKRNEIAIAISLFIIVIVGFFYFMADSKRFYEFNEDGTVTYNGKVVEGLNSKEFQTFGYYTGKDSSFVYYKGIKQPQLDIKTFESIGGYIFADKNGLYREPRWTGDELIPLEGIDQESFRIIGHRLYADKNHVYSLDLMAENPLVPMQGENTPNPASFEEIPGTLSFFRDNQSIYHSGVYGKLKRCQEIDRNTFEVLTYRVFKDKNQVYFLTYGLKQDGGNRNEETSSYDILRDADAASFVKISDSEFEDKNTSWTINDRKRNSSPSSPNRKPRTN